MTQPRELEEGLAQIDASSYSSNDLSPTDTVCPSQSPELFEKESREIYCSGEEKAAHETDRPPQTHGWFSFLRRERRGIAADNESGESHPQIKVRSLDTFPEGYPNLAAFHDSDESFMVYRRFGYIQARILLAKQDEMRLLEERLDALDAADMYENPEALSVRLSDEGHSEERRKLLGEIETKYREYATLLTMANQLTSLNKPSQTEYRSVSNYVHGFDTVHPHERTYINYQEDMITLRPGREHAWLDTMIESAIRAFRHNRTSPTSGSTRKSSGWLSTATRYIFSIFRCRSPPLPEENESLEANDIADTPPVLCSGYAKSNTDSRGGIFDYFFSDEISRCKSRRPEIFYLSRHHVDRCAVIIITIMILTLLIVPIWLLYHLVNESLVDGNLDGRINAICIGVLLIFTLAFSAMMSFMTRAQRHEILGAAAAYCAVLVVFLGNVGNS